MHPKKRHDAPALSSAGAGEAISGQTYADRAQPLTLCLVPSEPTERIHAQATEAHLGMLRDEVLEQVMRATNDDLLAAAFRDPLPGSREFLVNLGKLLSSTSGTVPTRSPLHQWGYPHPGRPDVDWRTHCPQSEGSLWGELLLLRALHGEVPSTDPLAELDALRKAAH